MRTYLEAASRFYSQLAERVLQMWRVREVEWCPARVPDLWAQEALRLLQSHLDDDDNDNDFPRPVRPRPTNGKTLDLVLAA